MAKKPIIYTTSECPRCRQLKKDLEALGVECETQNLEDPAVMTDLRCDGVHAMVAPVLKIGQLYFQVV